MCDYCGCRRSGPTAELHEEHEQLLAMSEVIDTALYEGADCSAAFAEFSRLLHMHAAKEEIGLFVAGAEVPPLAAQIVTLCSEHDDLHRWLADGPTGVRVPEALRLLTTHIDDEEHDLFPHIFHALDPEQWDEIELAHRAVEAVWEDPEHPMHPEFSG